MGRMRHAIPSMFHRRLVLLGAVVLGGFCLLAARLMWVTGVKGGESRVRAEARLIRQSWLPTTRGRILDRHGRVLAQDRPSYDIAVDYPVISGEWARDSAMRFARRAHRDSWGTLDAEARAELAARYQPVYEARVEGMWRLIAQGTGRTIEEIEAARADVVSRVERVQAGYTRRRAERERAKLVEAGIEIGPEEEARIARIAASPVAEAVEPHPIVRGVSDEVGFRFMRLGERQQSMFLTSEAGEAALDETQALLPGLKVIDTTARVYPFETMRVEIDRSTLPAPIRGDGSVQIEVDEVAGLILGSVRRGVYGADEASGDPGDAGRRLAALEEDPDLRHRSLIPGIREGDSEIDTGQYLPGDRVGNSGLEASLEHELRGLRGVRVENLRTRAVRERAQIPGRDTRLTLDIHLQARVRAVLDPALGLTRVQAWHHNEKLPLGTELDAGAVVLDVGSGEILAMVSTPTPPRDGDWSARGVSADELDLYMKIHSPYLNRAFGVPYPPGSIAKALILCGAAKAGVYEQGERIEATGHYLPNRKDVFRSWIYKQNPGVTHADQLGHDPDAVDALTVSSNVFFFTLGDRLGTRGVADVYRMFGLGEMYDLGLSGEWAGSVGALSNGINDGSDLSRDEAILLGIGQGPVTWTPLHAADAYATIARGGVRITPTLISRGGGAPSVTNLGIPTWAIRETLDGLRRAANDPRFGTGYDFVVEGGRDRVFNAPGVTVWGKTGTADASPIVVDTDGDGPQPRVMLRDGDHSWYLTLVGDAGGSPRYAVAVVVDYGGSGGRVSGPIANQIIHAMIQEGYLSGEPTLSRAGGR